MSAPWFIVTATPEISLERVIRDLEAEGCPRIDPEEVGEINRQIFDTRGLSLASPVPSVSFRPDPDRIASNILRINGLVDALTTPGVAVGPEFPLTLEDWIAAGPRAVLCLTSSQIPDHGESGLGEEPEACRSAYKQHYLQQLARSDQPVIFFAVEQQSPPEISAMLAEILRAPAPAAEEIIEEIDPFLSRESGGLPAAGVPFRVRLAPESDRSAVAELEEWHRRRIQQTAHRDRLAILEREDSKRKVKPDDR